MQYLVGRNATVNYAEGKTKMAAWFVSNCASHSRRIEMVKSYKSTLTSMCTVIAERKCVRGSMKKTVDKKKNGKFTVPRLCDGKVL